jgi:hypothetical protein
MPWLILFIGVIGVLAVVERKKTAAAAVPALPVTLPATGAGGAGETASQQEAAGAESTVSSIATAAASGNVAGVATAAISSVLTQLTQHSARLAAAKAENTAIPPVVAAFDADLAAIGAAFSQGQITATQAAQAIQELDQNIYQNLHGLVGKPGTAWQAPAPVSMTQDPGAPCNTSCTVSCCVYLNDLHSPLVAAYMYLLSGNLSAVTANAQPWLTSQYGGSISAQGFVLGVPKVYPPDDPAYGTFTRPAYSVSFVRTSALPTSTLASII